MHIFLQKGLGISLILWLVFMFCLILCTVSSVLVTAFAETMCHLSAAWNFWSQLISSLIISSCRLLRPASYKDSHKIPIPDFLIFFLWSAVSLSWCHVYLSVPPPGVTLGFLVFSSPFIWKFYFRGARNWWLS